MTSSWSAAAPAAASLAQRLAPTGKRILLLERGDYLPRSHGELGFQDRVRRRRRIRRRNLVRARRTQLSSRPALLCRRQLQGLRRGAVPPARAGFRRGARTQDGVSPAWPLGYDVFEPYYAEAERLFHVHGQRGEDPHEPPSSGPYPYPAVCHEPRIQALSDTSAADGLHPFHLPLGILLDETRRQGHADQRLHPLRRLRRLSLPAQRQGGRAGDLRRPDACGPPECRRC